MNNAFYSGMLNGLSKVNLGGFERSQAELHMRRAAAFVDMFVPSRDVAQAAAVEAPAVAVEREEYRRAA